MDNHLKQCSRQSMTTRLRLLFLIFFQSRRQDSMDQCKYQVYIWNMLICFVTISRHFFLFVFIGRTSDASVVLKHCVARYKDRNVKEEKQKFEDLTMFRVYNGLYTIYKRQDQVLLFLSLVKEMGEIAKKLENFAALIILATIYTNLEDTEE